MVNAYLLPEFGAATPLEAITTERIEAYCERLPADGHLSRRSVQNVRADALHPQTGEAAELDRN